MRSSSSFTTHVGCMQGPETSKQLLTWCALHIQKCRCIENNRIRVDLIALGRYTQELERPYPKLLQKEWSWICCRGSPENLGSHICWEIVRHITNHIFTGGVALNKRSCAMHSQGKEIDIKQHLRGKSSLSDLF